MLGGAREGGHPLAQKVSNTIEGQHFLLTLLLHLPSNYVSDLGFPFMIMISSFSNYS